MRVLVVALALLAGVAFVPVTRAAAADCSYPADVLDLSNWKETLPTGSEGDPTEITQPELATYSNAPWFTANSTCDAVQFRASVDGVTTSGSGYPRSELREMTDNGSEEAGWSATEGTHTMTIDEAITELPADKPEVVAGQIHDDSDDVTVFRLEDHSLYITNGDTTHYKLVTDDYALGTRFQAKFVAAGGQIKAYYNGTLEATIDDDDSGLYFKAGAYVQANCDKSSPCEDGNAGQVDIYGLTHTAS